MSIALSFPPALLRFTVTSTFFFIKKRLTRDRSWLDYRPRCVHALQHISHWISHVFTPSDRPFTHGRDRGWRRRWCCSNRHRCCRVPLSTTTTTTFTSAVGRDSGRRSRCIPAAHRRNQTTIDRGRNKYGIVSTWDTRSPDEALCTWNSFPLRTGTGVCY